MPSADAQPAAHTPPEPARPGFSRSHLRTVAGAVIGAAAGAAYAHFIGCRTGTCPITSSVWTAGLYGAVVGALAGWPGRDRPAGR